MQAITQPSQWASDTEVAEQFNITTKQLRAMSARGDFPAPLKFGRALRYSRVAIQSWLAAQAGAAVQEMEKPTNSQKTVAGTLGKGAAVLAAKALLCIVLGVLLGAILQQAGFAPTYCGKGCSDV